jgi:hypothetical protein
MFQGRDISKKERNEQRLSSLTHSSRRRVHREMTVGGRPAAGENSVCSYRVTEVCADIISSPLRNSYGSESALLRPLFPKASMQRNRIPDGGRALCLFFKDCLYSFF